MRRLIKNLTQRFDGRRITPNSISGGHIIASTITGSKIGTGTDGIDETNIDWSGSDGILQWGYGNWDSTATAYISGATASTTWTTKYTERIYVPANANSLAGEALIHRHPSFGWAMEARIYITSGGTAVSNNTTTYVAETLPAFDVSALNGWYTVEIQHRTTQASAEGRAYTAGGALTII